MSKLDELIKTLCPNGVEYYKLSDIFEQFSGMTGVSNKWAESGNCVFIDYLNAYNNMKIDTTALKNATVKNLKQTELIQGDILLTCASETPDECAISSVIEQAIPNSVFLDDHLFGLRLKHNYKELINTTFINYVFHSKSLRSKIRKAVRGVTRFYISNPAFMKITIPVPPLEVQCEIVRILDNFTKLTTELTTELTARKKQYEYYRNKLLTFDDTVPMVKLSDIATFSQGIQVDVDKQIPYQKEGYIRFLRIVDFVKDNEPPRYIMRPDNKYVKEDGDMVMIRYGASAAGKVFLQYSGAIANNMFQIKLLSNHITTKFLHAYLAQERMYNLIRGNCGASTMPAITFGQVGAIEIPLPPLEEQERIVSILDRFDALCNDISIGLPAEIEARQKQYEYYRDKLLTFQEKTA